MASKSKNSSKKIFVIGDVHGEYHGFAAALIAAKLMNPDLKWTGKQNILVQIGDIIDRGFYPIQVDSLLDLLQDAAKKTGGKVVRLIGNHELEILKKNYRITSLPYFQVEPFRDKLIKQVKEGSVQAAYNAKGFIITHAGICNNLYKELEAELPKITPSKLVKHINTIFKQAVLSGDYSHPIFNVTYMRGGHSSYGGIFWEDLRSLTLNYNKVPFRQIFGHTRITQNFQTPDKMLTAIDIGLHRVLEGTYSFPVIGKDKKITLKRVS
ncbi:MAG: metallophosphoesterase [Elusimicrobiaceae bacterium]|nr:metallophosphoesterase [Elusimicrobiaceae bacterium]